MDKVRPSPSLADLVRILYRPRQTMRRILDSGQDRWSVQIVILALFCASVDDADARHIGQVFSDLGVVSLVGLAALVLVATAAGYALLLFLLGWIATMAGRMLGGVGTAADVRAALAWALVPVIWSAIYRVPVVIFKNRIDVVPQASVKEVLLEVTSHGGCAIFAIILALQIVLFLWCLCLGALTLAEAHRFSPEKGFINLLIAVALPPALILAAVFAFR